MKKNCRIWWPAHLSTNPPHSTLYLFGWFIHSNSNILDLIVAFGSTDTSLHTSSLQEILHQTNGKMPMGLQDDCMLSILGCCQANIQSNGKSIASVNNDPDSINGIVYPKKGRKSTKTKKDMLELNRRSCDKKKNWIQLVYDRSEYVGRRIYWIPKLEHINWDGMKIPDLHLHVILYETPRYGGHYFSLGSYSTFEQKKSTIKKPMWVEDLYEKQMLPDLDNVVLAMNCAASAKLFFEEIVFPGVSTVRFCSMRMFLAFMWRLFAVSVASLSTLIYVILQFLWIVLSYGSQSWICIILTKLFRRTYKNVRFRCCQILYWPIFLQNSVHRSTSCVEYAEKAALRKHSMWSNVVVDVLFGNILGILMLIHAESVSSWTLKLCTNITNYVLRMGCVSLMGNPAGFKLNNELAGVLGMLSLNAVQIWSTVCFLMSSYFVYFIKGVAISGILFGLTTPAALVVDFISLATFHLRCLHWSISIIFSHQLQAVAALWRLFRDQKLNPLRQRLDSYDYTVDQHVVGSLLFTPMLLLLPTSSAFYIFFALLGTTASFVCLFIEIAISVIHATPFTKIILWIIMPKRFPSGLWVEIVSYQSDAVNDLETGSADKLVLFLHSSSLNIRQIVYAHYRFLCSAVSRLSFATSLYGILIGRSLPSTPNHLPSASLTCLPMTLPWMSINYKEYWRLCHDVVLAGKLRL